MSKILIRGAKVLGGEPQDVLIDGSAIEAVGTGISAEGAEVADSDRCTVVEQVANGVSIRMAVLYLLLGGNEPAVSNHRTEESK